MRSILVLLGLFAAGSSAAQQGAGSADGSGSLAKDAGSHRVIVQFSNAELGTQELLGRKALELRSKPGILEAKGFMHVGLVIVVCDSQESAERLVHSLEDDPSVEFATPDTYVYADGAPPEDASEEGLHSSVGERGLREEAEKAGLHGDEALTDAGTDLRQCSAQAGCAALNLVGDCCPAPDGTILACCGGTDAEILFAFHTVHGRYVVAEPWGPIRADRMSIDHWEKFEVIYNADRTVSLKTYFGTYVSALESGAVVQNWTLGDTERFTALWNADGTFSLRTPGGKYVMAHQDGRVLAESDRLDNWEKFTVVQFGTLGQRFPDDANFSALWGMHNDNDTDIDCPEAWHTFTGQGSSGIIVAVIDTGIDYTHPDLQDNMWVNPGEIPDNGIDDDNNGYIDDIFGADWVNNDGDPMDDQMHGTHCAGTIGGVGNNGIGVAGVAWRGVKLMALKFLSATGSGRTSDAVKAIDYAVAHGARITSNSWGGGSSNAALRVAISRAEEAGVLFVAAAGNSGKNNDQTPHYPSTYPTDNIIAVAATTRAGALPGFSCYGATTVDVAAPGTRILSTVPGHRYRFLSGTSMATPAVSGLAALIWMYRPKLSVMQVKDIILNTTRQLPALAGKVLTGGLVNAAKALAAAGREEAYPPVHAPQAIAFQDMDPLVGIISGIVSITAASDESDVEYYKVYFLSRAGFPMDAVGNVTATGARVLEVALAPAMPLPKYAVGLVAVSGNATGEMAVHVHATSSPMLILEDYGIPEHGPQGASWGGDTDPREGWVAGLLSVKRAASELSVSQYNIYWRRGDGSRGPPVGSIPAIGYTEPRCFGATCPLINQTRLPSGGYTFDLGSYGNNQDAHIIVSGPGFVTITRFDTERFYDVLTVAHEQISGQPVVPMTVQLPVGQSSIKWASDESISGTGWTFDLFPGGATAEVELGATRVGGQGLEIVAAYGKTELTEGISVDIIDYYSDMPPSPAFAPKAIFFTDQGNATGVIAGVAHVKPMLGATSEGGITYYKLDLATSDGEPVASLGRVDANGDATLRLPIPRTHLPAGATQLLARAGNRFGLGTGKTLFSLVNAPSVAHSPQKIAEKGNAMEMLVLGSNRGVEPKQAAEPWLPRASLADERQVVWAPTSTQAFLSRSRVFGALTVPALDAHVLAADDLLCKAIRDTITGMLPHLTEESVEISRIVAEVGLMARKKLPIATVEFLVATREGAPANALDRIEARLILLSMGGGDVVRFTRDLLERFAKAGTEMPADTRVRVGEPLQLLPGRPGRSLAARRAEAAREPSAAPTYLLDSREGAARPALALAGLTVVLAAAAALVLARRRGHGAVDRGDDKAVLEFVHVPLGPEA